MCCPSPSIPNAAPAAPATPPATLIYDDWYVAMRSDRLRAGHTATATLLGIPLLLGRTRDNKLFAMRDSCPHRGIPLSFGTFDTSPSGSPSPANTMAGNLTRQRSVQRDSLVDAGGHAGLRPHLCNCLSLRRARWLCVGLCARARIRPRASGRSSGAAAQCRNCRSSARAFDRRISRPSCPAMSITASSASWIPRTVPLCISPGGGAAAPASMSRRSNSSPFHRVFA